MTDKCEKIIESIKKGGFISEADIKDLCSKAKEIIVKEPNVLQFSSKYF